jgi:transposase
MSNKKPNVKKQNRRRHSPQFKQLAVERSQKEGVPTVAADLGLSEQLLYNWRRIQQSDSRSFEERQLQQAEMTRLKRENARLTEELEFLKKAAAYFAKQPK